MPTVPAQAAIGELIVQWRDDIGPRVLDAPKLARITATLLAGAYPTITTDTFGRLVFCGTHVYRPVWFEDNGRVVVVERVDEPPSPWVQDRHRI